LFHKYVVLSAFQFAVSAETIPFWDGAVNFRFSPAANGRGGDGSSPKAKVKGKMKNEKLKFSRSGFFIFHSAFCLFLATGRRRPANFICRNAASR